MATSDTTLSGSSAAFFDLDRTLISGSSAFAFGTAAFRAGLVPKKDLVADAKKAVQFKLLGATDGVSEAVRDRILAAVTGVKQSELVALGDVIIPDLIARVRPESQSLLDMHHEAGRDTWIVSASPVEIVAPLAEALGMTGGLGTCSALDNGVYTGELDGPFCYGPGKAEIVAKLAAERGYDLRLSYAYSDSVSDLPLFELVGHPVAVNADRPLASVAIARGWPRVRFARRAKAVVATTSALSGAAILAGATYALGRRHGRIHEQARPAWERFGPRR